MRREVEFESRGVPSVGPKLLSKQVLRVNGLSTISDYKGIDLLVFMIFVAY